MKLLKTIRDIDLGFESPDPDLYIEREASRAIVFDENNNIALLYSLKDNCHKLPGGGVEEGEDIKQALNREMMEEVGCQITDVKELGIIEEYRNKDSLHQVSHCFIAKLEGKKGEPEFTQSERKAGFQLVWLSLDDAIKTLDSEKMTEFYRMKFMVTRDLLLLNEAKAYLNTYQ
ncbi:MAG: NUDIX domain-containing protein [Candidatus Pacebacteria bacterium]|nr:NUDIX domain-containing protein [Candidatus Paceibacterota bacterium]MCF7862863.1 NUDIX domain-containing protein [Candidatus Paceibacterota bacterium]